MKHISKVLAGSTAALLLAAAPVLASAHEGKIAAKVATNASIHGDANPGLHLGSLLHFGTKTGQSDERGHKEDKVRKDDNKKHMATSTRPTKDMHATVGVVTAINGSTFTIDPVGRKATTTVTTDASTTFRANGQATTSSALKVGSHVALIGTSTASTSISASIVSIFSKGLGFFGHFFAHFGKKH